MFLAKLFSTRAGILLLVGLLLHGLAYSLPFLGESSGMKFFVRGMVQLFNGALRPEYWGIFAAFYIPVWTLPVFIVRWFIAKPLALQWRVAMVLCLLCPHLVSIITVIRRLPLRVEQEELVGYGVWLLSYGFIALALFYKRKQLQQERALMDHLIE